MTPPEISHLPPDFVWGVATAAYQIEGGVSQDGRGQSIWDTFSHTPGRTAAGDTGDVACDHRNRWEEDLDLLVDLGVSAYRLSLSWPRLQPSGTGPLNPAGVAWYRQLLEGVHARGITPFVTLYHWDLPQPLEDLGGWTRRETSAAFARYAEQVVDALGDLAADWITINEPWCAALLGYGYGVHAPGRTDMRAATAASHHLNLAHGLATTAIRSVQRDARVGVTNIVADLVPEDPDRDAAAVGRLDALNHQLFLHPVFRGGYPRAVHELLDPYGLAEVIEPGDLDAISVPLDFAGINHYQRVVVAEDPDGGVARARETPAGETHTSFGWSITPDALTRVLIRIRDEVTDLPIHITENGASFADVVDADGQVHDTARVEYLRGYLAAVDDAIRDGVDVRGYFAWSLIDNFEWAEGYDKRFGLVHVDFASQRRTPKSSAAFYSSVIASHRNTRREPVSLAAAE